MPGARWFPEARLNFAQNLLERRRADDDGDALVFWGEDKVKRQAFRTRELHALASRVSAALAAHGSPPATAWRRYMPNMPETIIAMLGATSRGAIWSSCSPDFGVQGVVDRFGQIEPRVLFTVDGYYYNGKVVPILDKVAEIVASACRRSSGSSSCRISRKAAMRSDGLSERAQCGGVGRVARAVMCRGRSTTRSCRSTIRCTSCTRPARRACPNASCTAPAERCCST